MMKIKNRNLLIAVIITCLLAVFIFFINNNTELGWSFGAYVKLQLTRVAGFVLGIIAILGAIVCRILRKQFYRDHFAYIFTGILNTSLGIYGMVYFILIHGGIVVMHQFLINLVIGVIIISDIFLLVNNIFWLPILGFIIKIEEIFHNANS